MLEVRNLSKRYGQTVALDNASIRFRPGTVHAVLGENGSGKSTLVKLLSGIVAPDSGAVLIGGEPFAGRTPADWQRRGLATVFQEVLVAPDRSVTDNILLGLDGFLHRRVPISRRRALAEETLARFAVSDVPPDAPAGALPLALQQLVVLARAVVREPQVMVLDEVTAALDFSDRESVFRLMRGQAEAGRLVIFITHRMDEVMALSDDITVLRAGKVVRSGPLGDATPEQLLADMAARERRATDA